MEFLPRGSVAAPSSGSKFTAGTGQVRTGFFPMAVGSSWSRDKGQQIERILSVETVNGVTVYKFEREVFGARARVATYTIEVTRRDGVTFYERRDSAASRAVLVLVEPLNAGATWQIDSNYDCVVTSVDAEYTAANGQTYKDCVKVGTRSRMTGRMLDGSEQVYAPGVGMVSGNFDSYTPGPQR